MNRFRTPLLFVILALVVVGYAQKPQPVDQTEANLRKTIEYLASDQLEGRRTGEPGANLAAKYIADQFKKIGLRAGAKDKNTKSSYLQEFPYITGVEMAKTGNSFTINAITKEDEPTLNHLTLEDPFHLAVLPVGSSPNAAMAGGQLVFAGYGITSKEPAFDDYMQNGAPLDVKGKVVIVFDKYPDADNPHSPYGRFDIRTKALIAKDHGAIGLVLISREAVFENDRLRRMEYDQSLGEAAIPTFVMSRVEAAMILGLSGEKLSELEAANGRDVGIKPQYGNAAVNFEVNLVKKSVPAYNVIGILPGTDPTLKNEAIVIGAHYDHLGHGGNGSLAANSTEIHHGADDNASGTAAIIELPRQFAREKRNKRTLIFMSFSGEEEGLFGSNFYVNNPVFPLDKTIAMINLDMVGRLNDNKLTIGGIGTASEWKSVVNGNSPETKAVIVEKIEPNGERKVTQAAPSQPYFNLQLNEDGFGPSDHSSFYGKKIPVLFFFTGTHNDYHKPSDTVDKINFDGELDVVDYVQSIIKAIDENPQRPTYTVAKTTMQGGRSGFNISLGTIPNYADSTDGLLLDGVRDGSPAAKAGVKAGDKVVKLAGHDIRNVMDYTYVLGEMKAGEEYEIVVLRGGERLTLKIVPVKR